MKVCRMINQMAYRAYTRSAGISALNIRIEVYSLEASGLLRVRFLSASAYFPIQNRENIFPSRSSVEIGPVIRPR